MLEGKESSTKGWVMTDILSDVLEKWGVPARDYSYTYIVSNFGSNEVHDDD